MFYLGVHRPHWLGQVDIPLFVSHRTLGPRKSLPVASAPWALDSGGFTELTKYGKWVTGESEYVEAARRYRDEIGLLDWAAPQDWMCEPFMLERTGLSVREHQERTIANYLSLRDSGLPFIPVLQGWVLADYIACAALYTEAGVDLAAEPLVGLGSVCRRQSTRPAEEIVVALAREGIKLHGFGVKVTGLARYGYLLKSADSMAWSYGGWRSGPCPPPSRCANHLHYALSWRERVLRSMDYQQTHLGTPA